LAILEINGLTKNFGGLVAVNNLDMEVEQGEIVGLIGPNGAGKTTVFNLITGFIQLTKGNIRFENSDITGRAPYIIARKGIVRTFQQNTTLPDLTVLQNLLSASHIHPRTGIAEAIFNTRAYVKKGQIIHEKAVEILNFLGLHSQGNELAKNLPHGHQRLLGIALALCASPKMLLLDEPLGGMNPLETSESLAFIKKIRASGTTILIVEHNMKAVMALCDRIVVLNFGRKIAEGRPQEVSKNQEVIEAYLGVVAHVAQG
jgi:branched-chain amino acid transport system ATP-binding protein